MHLVSFRAGVKLSRTTAPQPRFMKSRHGNKINNKHPQWTSNVPYVISRCIWNPSEPVWNFLERRVPRALIYVIEAWKENQYQTPKMDFWCVLPHFKVHLVSFRAGVKLCRMTSTLTSTLWKRGTERKSIPSTQNGHLVRPTSSQGAFCIVPSRCKTFQNDGPSAPFYEIEARKQNL